MSRLALGAILALVITAGCGGGKEAAGRAAHDAAPTVTSTLDRRAVLPPRVRWIARPSVPASKVSEVRFLIDGQLRGVERDAPYNYGSDDLHGHLGWLVTSWLSPGPHRFTVRARLTDGRTASTTTIATVRKPPRPPVTLAGRWHRRITQRAIDRIAEDGPPPAGAWDLFIDHVGIWSLDPAGSGVIDHVRIRQRSLISDAPVWMVQFGDDGNVLPGMKPVTRFGHTGIGGHFCREDGPPGAYRWVVTGSRLTLTARNDPCANRRAIWQGTWTRVK